MTRVDLDAVERHWATVGNSACPECQDEALVAELRAAREVVEACGPASRQPPTPKKLRDALAAYDRAVSP